MEEELASNHKTATSTFEQIRVWYGIDMWVVSRNTYHLLDLASFVLFFLNQALLSGLAFQVATAVVVTHSLTHIVTDFQSTVPFLKGMTIPMLSLSTHAKMDLIIGASFMFIASMDESMGCSPFGARVYKVLFWLYVPIGGQTFPWAFAESSTKTATREHLEKVSA